MVIIKPAAILPFENILGNADYISHMWAKNRAEIENSLSHFLCV